MNLSSSEDEEGYSSNDEDIANILSTNNHIAKGQSSAGENTSINFKCPGRNDSDEESEGFHDVDWEDASIGSNAVDVDDEMTDSKMPAKEDLSVHDSSAEKRFPSRDIVINFGDKNTSIKNDGDTPLKAKAKGKRRRINKIQDIPQNMQNLLQELRRAHILSSISRSIFLSSFLDRSDEDIWSIAYSLVPPEFLDGISIDSNRKRRNECFVPSYDELKNFCLWFFDFVNNVDQRRQIQYRSNVAAGAPRTRARKKMDVRSGRMNENRVLPKHGSMQEPLKDKLIRILSYLSPSNDSDHYQLQHVEGQHMDITLLDKLLVFICITRSLKWRVRFVACLDPMAKELTVDHPIFSSTMKNTFQSIIQSIDKRKKTKKRKRPNWKVSTEDYNSTHVFDYEGGEYNDFAWAEVLCAQISKKGEKKHPRWTHVDPSRSLFDEPSRVETIDSSFIGTNGKAKRPKNTRKVRKPVSYVLGVENFHHLPEKIDINLNINPVFFTTRLVDITPRYANRWSLTLKRRGANAKDIAIGKCPDKWWSKTLKKVNNSFVEQRFKFGLSSICMDAKKCKPAKTIMTPYKIEKRKNHDREEEILILDDSSDEQGEDVGSDNDLDDTEEKELSSAKDSEAIPTSKASFKNHPLFVIPSVMKMQEVLAPDAKKRICGMFKGEMVYKRSDVSKANVAKKWLYQGRKVREKELKYPAKVIKARKKPMPKGFQALESYGTTTKSQDVHLHQITSEEDDGKRKLYGIFQTEEWSPPYVGPNDPIPVSKHKNVELALLNPGLIHLDLYRMAKVAKQLGVPYAPCLLGFEGHGGNRTPTIRGIVVHKHNEDLLREAHVELQSQMVEKEYKERQRIIYGKWKRLIKGMITKERLAREYAND